MNWELAARRQVLGEWRDRQIMDACHLFNTLATDALAAFEHQLSEAHLPDTVWDPAAFADSRIDAWLRQAAAPALLIFRRQASIELASIDPGLAALSDALTGSEGIVLPTALAHDVPADASSPGKAGKRYDAQAAGRTGWRSRLGDRIAKKPLLQRAARLGNRAKSIIGKGAKDTERVLQDKAGLYDRLRKAAALRIKRQWMGDGLEEPRPVLAQLIAMIDKVALEARISLT